MTGTISQGGCTPRVFLEAMSFSLLLGFTVHITGGVYTPCCIGWNLILFQPVSLEQYPMGTVHPFNIGTNIIFSFPGYKKQYHRRGYTPCNTGNNITSRLWLLRTKSQGGCMVPTLLGVMSSTHPLDKRNHITEEESTLFDIVSRVILFPPAWDPVLELRGSGRVLDAERRRRVAV